MVSLEELYDALMADGAPLPLTYAEFKDYMTSGPNGGYTHRKQVYDALKADGAPLPDTYEDFSKALFAPKTPTDTAPTDTAPTQQEAWEPTPLQKALKSNSLSRIVDEAHVNTEATIQRM